MADHATEVDTFSEVRIRKLSAVPVGGYFNAGPLYGTSRVGRPDLLFIVNESGAGRFRVGRATVTLGPNQAAIWLPNADQFYTTCPDAGHWRFRFVHVFPRAEWWPSLDWPMPLPGLAVATFHDTAAQAAALDALAVARQLVGSPLPGADRLIMNAIEASILWCATQATEGQRVDERVRAACDCARRHLDRRVTVAELAEVAGLSEPRLTSLFRTSLGTSPARYAEDVRLHHAAKLLETSGLSGKEVAHACGFHDHPHFSRRFKRLFGSGPSAYAARS